MFAKFRSRAVSSATLLFSFLNLVPTQVNAQSPLITKRAEYLPLQAMSHDVGTKSMRGYFVQSNGTCSVVLMVTERINPETPAPLSAARLRLVLQPGAITGLDSAEGRSLNFTCDRAAAKLLVDDGETSALVTQQKARLYN